MKCSRRNFLAGSGALILTTGVAGTSVVSSSLYASDSEQGQRLGMVHDENACIGCTACTDACREVNKVPDGVTRLKKFTVVNRLVNFLTWSISSLESPASIVITLLVYMYAQQGLPIKMKRLVLSTYTRKSVSVVVTVLLLVLIKCVSLIPSTILRTNVTSVEIPI